MRVTGSLHFDAADGELERHRLYLDARARRRGIGSPLIEELLGRLGPEPGYMLLVLAANAPALRFYRRHGLRVERRVDGLAHRRGMGVEWGRDGFGGQLHLQEVAKKRGVELANLYAHLLREEALAQEPLRAGSLKLESRCLGLCGIVTTCGDRRSCDRTPRRPRGACRL